AMSVLGLLPAGAEITSGEVRFGDEDLRRVSSARMRDIRGREIGTIFQEPMSWLNPVLTIGRQIGEVVERHEHMSGSQARDRTLELLGLVGLPDAKRRIDPYRHEISGGARARA